MCVFGETTQFWCRSHTILWVVNEWLRSQFEVEFKWLTSLLWYMDYMFIIRFALDE